MLARLRFIWNRHRLLVSALVLAGLVTVFFAVRSVVFTVYWSDPAHRDQALEGWMTPGYVAYSWDIERETLITALGPAAEPGRRLTLDQIAQRNGEPLQALKKRIEAAIAASRTSGG